MNVHMLTDEKILEILKKDSQKGLVLLMEKYTGLIWHVVSFHIRNPEDIKECVNDTFSKFYFQRKRFDSDRASLPVYLTAIARKVAISRYRRESARQAGTLDENAALEDGRLTGTELRVDMERALAMLKPNELQIIRMKYYDGMTVREIAESLDLPYETVKKRHQRSVLKLSQSFLLLLLLLLCFSICVYGVLRYFDIIPPIWHQEEEIKEQDPVPDDGIDISDDRNRKQPDIPGGHQEEDTTEEFPAEQQAGAPAETVPVTVEPEPVQTPSAIENYTVSPGYGINTNPQNPVYSLAEQVVYETDGYMMTISEVSYINNRLVLTFILHLKELLAEGYEGWCACDALEGQGIHNFVLGYGEDSWESQRTLHYRINQLTDAFRIPFDNVELPSSDEGLKMLTLTMMGEPSFVFNLKVEKQDPLTEHPYQVGEYGGVLAVPRLEDGSLIIAIYPLDEDDEYKIIPALIRYSLGDLTGESITVTGEDGTVLTGRCLWYSPGSLMTYYEWDFGKASPGNYTLNIPAVILEYETTEKITMPLNLEANTWEDQVYQIPKGDIYLKECVPLDMDPDIQVAIDDGYMSVEEGLEMWEEMKGQRSYWRMIFSYHSEDPALSVAGLYGLSVRIPGCETGKARLTTWRNNTENETCTLSVTTDAVNTGDLGNAVVTLEEGDLINYRWNQEFEIPFTVN